MTYGLIEIYLWKRATQPPILSMSTNYKGVINYGLKFSAYDRAVVNYIEDYNMYYLDVLFEKISFSAVDSTITIEGRVAGGWTFADVKGNVGPNLVEMSVGDIKETTFYFRFYPEYFLPDVYKIEYKGEQKKTGILLDSLPAFIHSKFEYNKLISGVSEFKIHSKVGRNSVLSIGKIYCVMPNFMT